HAEPGRGEERGEHGARRERHAARAGRAQQGQGQDEREGGDHGGAARSLHGRGVLTRSGWSAQARYQLASAACWLRVPSSSVRIWPILCSRTARSFDSSGSWSSPSRTPGHSPSSTTSGSAVNARSDPMGAIPVTPVSRPTLTAPADSMSAPIAVSPPAVIPLAQYLTRALPTPCRP